MNRIRLAFALLAVIFASNSTLAVEPIPSIDPCLLAPESCLEIEPIDPCLLNPGSCLEIELIDPCVLAPETCEGPPPIDPDYAFGGMQKVKIRGVGTDASVTMQLIQVSSLGLFVGTDDAGYDYAGAWVPLHKNGLKVALTLDTPSQAALASKIGAIATAMTGVPQTVTFTRPPKIVGKIDETGAGTLKIKCKAVLDGTNVRVTYKAKLVGGAYVRALLP